jgi:hypothetical protein
MALSAARLIFGPRDPDGHSAVEYRSQFAVLVAVLALIAFELLRSMPAMSISPYNFILRGTWVIA